MAESRGKAATKIASSALEASVELQGHGGRFLFRIATGNVKVARELIGVAAIGTVFVGLGSLWAWSNPAGAFINLLLKRAFGGENDDQDMGEPRIGSLLVPIRCFTDERFLEVLADYESGEIKRRLEKELDQVGLKVEGLTVKIENMDEVKKQSAAIRSVQLVDSHQPPRFDYRRVGIIQDIEEITKEEKKAAFELGYTIVSIKMLCKAKQTPKPRWEIRMLYNKYIGIASKLGFDLEDPPPEETTTDAEMEAFITKQSNQVDECFARRGNISIITLYNAGYQMTVLLAFLTFKFKDDPVEKIQLNESIQDCAEKLKSCAAELDIDLNKELEKALNVQQMNEIDEIEKQMREKFIRCERSQNRRSEIDQTRFITDEVWTVSLVRLPDSSSSEHAFLIVEGKSGNKSMIWFVDFVTSGKSDLYLPGTRDGKVRVGFHESNEVSDSSSELLFKCRKNLMKIHKGDRLLFSTWQIRKFTAETLMKNIQAQKASPPKYNILGNSKLAASSKDTDHNCFTFAKTMLRNLNDEYIIIPEDTLDEWICSPTSRFLVEKQFNYKSWTTPTSASVLALVFLAGVITAYSMPKLFVTK